MTGKKSKEFTNTSKEPLTVPKLSVELHMQYTRIVKAKLGPNLLGKGMILLRYFYQTNTGTWVQNKFNQIKDSQLHNKLSLL